MSFVYPYDSEKNTFPSGTPEKKKTLLQSAGHNGHKERAFLSASRLKAGLTVEAALAVPVFLLFVAGILSFLMLLSLQLSVQNGMEETARSLTRKAYLSERTELPGFVMGQPAMELALHSDPLSSALANPHIRNTQTLFSTYEDDTGLLDLVLGYDFDIPGFPEAVPDLHLAQRVYCRAWIGRELDTNGAEGAEGGSSEEDKQKVYVAENGTVYHTSKDCHYLDLSIRSVSGSRVDSLRNKSGAKYYGCPLCAKYAAAAGTVYITDYGENWHTSLSCSGLKRTISEKNLSDVGDLPLCSKCGGRH